MWLTPTPTSSPTAAVLCPDSVLVAKDGAVRFGPPPAYGGSAGMGATPRVAVWHGRPTAGQLSGFGIPSQVLTARSSWPPRSQSRSWPRRRYWTPVIPPPARGAPTLPREPEGAGGGARAPGRRGGPQGQRLCPDPALSGLGCVPQHGWLWLCHPRTRLRCGQLRAVRAGWPEPSAGLARELAGRGLIVQLVARWLASGPRSRSLLGRRRGRGVLPRPGPPNTSRPLPGDGRGQDSTAGARRFRPVAAETSARKAGTVPGRSPAGGGEEQPCWARARGGQGSITQQWRDAPPQV